MTVDVNSAYPANDTVSVAILAGGLSTRMGSDKALLRLDPAGPTLLERVIAATAVLRHDRFIVSRSATDYQDFGLPVVADRYPGTGVLGAIGTGLYHAACQRVIVVSCDMPFLNAPALSWMATLGGPFDAFVPVIGKRTRQGGELTFQTLHAMYRRSCLPAIESALQMGDLRSIAFLAAVKVRQVEESELRRLDTRLLTLLSVNTPDDLAYAREVEKEQKAGQLGEP
jgi:molybdopterin-guanine dinucleotide biosynthesis protein A